MDALNRFVNWIEKFICVVTFVVMLILTFVNVVSRFVLHMSLSFSDEIVTTLFVLASLAGSSIAIKDGLHLGLDYITTKMSPKAQGFLFFLSNILGVIFWVIVLYYGIGMVQGEFTDHQVSARLGIPEWIYGMTIPVGCVLLIVRYAITIYLQFATKGKEAE